MLLNVQEKAKLAIALLSAGLLIVSAYRAVTAVRRLRRHSDAEARVSVYTHTAIVGAAMAMIGYGLITRFHSGLGTAVTVAGGFLLVIMLLIAEHHEKVIHK